MKKYFITFILALAIGFFLSNFFLNQYRDYKGVKVSNSGEELYFIQYGVFSSLESMEENTISLENYVYTVENNMYYVYIGISADKDVSKKIAAYYKKIGYETIEKKYLVSNKNFLELLGTYDQIIKGTEDETALSSLINQVLIKYEEVVIHGG